MYKVKKETTVRVYSDVPDMQGIVNCISKYLLAQPELPKDHKYTITILMDIPGSHGLSIQDHEEDFSKTIWIPEDQ